MESRTGMRGHRENVRNRGVVWTARVVDCITIMTQPTDQMRRPVSICGVVFRRV